MIIDKKEFLSSLKTLAERISTSKPDDKDIISFERYFDIKYLFKCEDDRKYLLIYLCLKNNDSIIAYIEYVFKMSGVSLSTYDTPLAKNKRDFLILIPYMVAKLVDENDEFNYQAYREYREIIEQSKRIAQEEFYSSLCDISEEIEKREQVSMSMPAHLYPCLEETDDRIIMSLKVGRGNKTYIIKDVRELLNGIKKNIKKEFGKELSIILNMNSFDETSRALLDLIFSYQANQNLINGRFVSLKDNNFLAKVLEIYKGLYVSLNGEDYYSRMNEVKVMIRINKHYVLSVVMPENYSYLKDSSCLIDYNNRVIDKIKADRNIISLIKLINSSDFPCIENHLDDFKYSIVLRYPNIFLFDDAVKDSFAFEALTIRVYFDIEKNIVSYHEELYDASGIGISVDELNPYNKAQYQRYQRLLQLFGFDENKKLTNLSDVWNFLMSDFSELKSLAEVYLSDNIKMKTASKFTSPQFMVNSNGSMVDVFLNDSIYTDEELKEIYLAIKQKKKYIFLKDNIINLDDPSAEEFKEHIDEYSLLSDKKISTFNQLPIYYAFKSLDGLNGVKLNNEVKDILSTIKDFKKADIDIAPINGELRDYQIDGVKWLTILYKYHLCGVLADDMGLGKTIEIISFLKTININKPVLIVSPKSLIFNWINEFSKFDPSVNIKAIYGTKKDREKTINKIDLNKKCVYITSYDSLRQDEELYKDVSFEIMILDEAQAIKNSKAKKTLTVTHINSEVRFVLTGTPIENSVMDLWSIFNFLMPGYLLDATSFKDEIGEDNYLDRIKKKVAPFILRRNKKDVLKDLPPKYEMIMSSEMKSEQKKIYEAIRMEAKNLLSSGNNSLVSIFSMLTRLRQVCIEPSLFIENYHDGSGKMDELEEIIKDKIEGGHRMLIFSQFVKALEIVETILRKDDINYLMITGKTDGEDRVNITNEFNKNHKYKVVLISLKAGGTGLNLIGADTVIHLDPWWNVAAQDQATDRAYRIGQDKNVEVIKLICEDSIEQRVVELQNYKKELIASLISDDESSITNLSLEDIQYMLK